MTRILVIEDNPDNLELMTYLLKQFGYKTLTAMDGEAGLALAKESNPDLIICDIQLPKLNGYEIAKQLKADPKYQQIPLIAVTAYAMVGDKDSILSVGYDGYISKPIDPETFVKEIRNFIKQFDANDFKLDDKLDNTDDHIDNTLTNNATILVVDDSYENRELSRTLLESIQLKVLLAKNVKQALEILDTNKADLVLSDMHLPEESGLDFLKLLKSNPKMNSLPIILISSSRPTEKEQQECLAVGANKFILRPIEPQLFLNLIKQELKVGNK